MAASTILRFPLMDMEEAMARKEPEQTVSEGRFTPGRSIVT